ncbi:MAG: hypothetical protein DRQ61_10055 [Gammaproteobacteria bacterium]|nr:MAG: hypothetical protein DRQ56_08160 [Gammaproteobacteria bacterium]RLA20392.1 MAG: hypothetical protein DRQ61_10055 [Gammaproteobacteria bacterium]
MALVNQSKKHFLLTAAAFVIVIAGMKASASILTPFLLSTFIAIICTPAMFWLHKKGMPSTIAVLLIVLGVLVLGSTLVVFVGTSIEGFTQSIPLYKERLGAMTVELRGWLENHGIHVSLKLFTQYLDPTQILQFSANTLSGLGGMLTNTFLILFTVIFILFEAFDLPGKLRLALGSQHKSFSQFDGLIDGVNEYLAIKTSTSLATGVAVASFLYLMGVDFPVLWGLVSFLLNFVPNIGSFIAAVPALLLALVQLGPQSAVYVALGYVVVNVAIGNVIEPKMLGKGLGLSTLVVFLSLIFWGWVFGPVGMFLSVPITMIVKIALENNEETHWIAIMLGSETADESGERFFFKHESSENTLDRLDK